MSEIDQRDSINDDVSLFDDMSQGLAELLGSCSIIDKTTKQNRDDDTKQRTDTINIPSELSGVIIGPGGAHVQKLQRETGARIRIKKVLSNKADSTVTLVGTTRAMNLAKAEIEKMRQTKIKKTVMKTRNNKKFGGWLPNSWLTNPLPGKLIDDGLLPIKCPLHQNFAKEIESQKGEPFTLDDVWRLEKVHNRRIGLIVDSTKTNRYYDWTEVTARETKYKKVPLEVPDNLTEMPFDIIHQLVDYIDEFRTTHPDDLVAIHCSKTNRCGLIIVCYLCRVRGLPLTDALRQFRDNSDGTGIYRQVFIDKLHEEYCLSDEPIPICPDKPAWVID